MSKISTLKSILQKQDTEQGFEKFAELLKSQSLHSDNVNLLLRWAVQNQKKHFGRYYKLLCQYGANVNFVDTRQRKSNLMIACEHKNQEIVEVLVNDERVDFLLEDSTNKTVLFYAIANKIKTIGQKYVRILLRKCPQLITNNNRKYSALLQAINLNKVQLVKVLLEEGFDPNQVIDNNNNTHLHEAVRVYKTNRQKPGEKYAQAIVTLMFEKGADPMKVNSQGKNCFQVAEKYSHLVQQLYAKIKTDKKAQNNTKKQTQASIKPILYLNDAKQRQQVFQNAEQIYKKYKSLIDPLIKSKTAEVTPIVETEQQGFSDDPFQPSQNIINKLTQEIQRFANQCMIDHNNARKELEDFIKFLTPITGQLGFSIEVYGSYATGLWINQCDIDILLIPMRQIYPHNKLMDILEFINQKFKGTIYQRASIVRSVKIPLMRVLIGQDKDIRKSRRIDLSILSPNNSGRQHVQYVNQFIRIFPQIKPLFFVIKKLTQNYKMYDPAKFGVRSFALFLMLVIFMQEPHSDSLGDLLLRFLYKYGYIVEYKYDESICMMVLNLPDPINNKNDMGKNTDAFLLQRMFKTAYMMLHTRDIQNRLDYMFESRQMFM